jgi:uncharacterized protein (TIGR02145 family)
MEFVMVSYRNCIFLLCTFILLHINVIGQSPGITATDYDGNIYNSVILGSQTWLKENLNSLHYCDGTEIPNVVAYNNDESLANIYGRLYTWDAAMYGSNDVSSRGACPCGWHVPSDEEWKELEDFLGGAAVAGGKMKETGTAHWYYPNTGADNSSGLTILPGGEYDMIAYPPVFSFLHRRALFWTSKENYAAQARGWAILHNESSSSIFSQFKTKKFSVRCVKDTATTTVEDAIGLLPPSFSLSQNYPNPFNPTTIIEYNLPISEEINISVYNTLGNKVRELYSGKQIAGTHNISFSGNGLPSGFYYYELKSDNNHIVKRCLLMK